MLYLILSRLRSTELSVSSEAFKEAVVTTFLTSSPEPQTKVQPLVFVQICLNLAPCIEILKIYNQEG